MTLREVMLSLCDAPYAEAKARLVAQFEASYTEEVMRRAGGNKTEAAKLAGLDRGNFRRLLKKKPA
jgi:DNA-binding protein Fis